MEYLLNVGVFEVVGYVFVVGFVYDLGGGEDEIGLVQFGVVYVEFDGFVLQFFIVVQVFCLKGGQFIVQCFEVDGFDFVIGFIRVQFLGSVGDVDQYVFDNIFVSQVGDGV